MLIIKLRQLKQYLYTLYNFLYFDIKNILLNKIKDNAILYVTEWYAILFALCITHLLSTKLGYRTNIELIIKAWKIR